MAEWPQPTDGQGFDQNSFPSQYGLTFAAALQQQGYQLQRSEQLHSVGAQQPSGWTLQQAQQQFHQLQHQPQAAAFQFGQQMARPPMFDLTSAVNNAKSPPRRQAGSQALPGSCSPPLLLTLARSNSSAPAAKRGKTAKHLELALKKRPLAG